MEIRLAKALLPLVTTYIKSKWLTKCIHINGAMMENAFLLLDKTRKTFIIVVMSLLSTVCSYAQ
jgi:hypothetical protein